MILRALSMPRLGETMEEGTIAAWLISPGQSFKRGQPLLEVETDKTVVEYPALGDGVLEETLVAPGDVVAVGAPIAKVRAEQWEDASSTEPNLTESPVPEQPNTPVKTGGVAASTPTPASAMQRAPDAPLRATPLARRLARQSGIALETLAGSGRRGRIEARDVQAVGAGSGGGGTRAGAGSGTVVLVHGYAGDASTWAALTAALTRAGKTVIAPDLPGHGQDRTTPQNTNDLIHALTPRLSALGPVHLVGHSLGAFVAAHIAAAQPSRIASLTLIAPAGLGREIDTAFVQGMAHASTAGELAHLLRRLGPKAATLSPDALQTMADGLAQGRLRPLADALAGPLGQKIDILAPLSRLPSHIPLRVLFGTDDRIIPVNHIFNLPPRAAVHLLPTGHMPQWDAPAEVAEIVSQAVAAPATSTGVMGHV